MIKVWEISRANAIFNKNYPLVGFAAGSVYSKDVGHMTLCLGTYSRNGTNFVELLDGHRTEVVSRAWSKYNDYICDIHPRRKVGFSHEKNFFKRYTYYFSFNSLPV